MNNLPIWTKATSPPPFVAVKNLPINKKTIIDELLEGPKDCGCKKKKSKVKTK